MNAIVPLNITALRVSPTDASNVVTGFKGRIANFDNMPFGGPSPITSTGDAVAQLLESNDSPLATLNTGIHLHWELPDYFRKGVQAPGSSQIIFPQVPNRWLVTRYLNMYDSRTGTWSAATNHSWVIESDYISMTQLKDADGKIRPSVPVPLPVNPGFGVQPYRYMGRVVEAASWPLNVTGDQYLSDYNDAEGKPCYLTSIGFLGPGFSSYYPDCCSVFGFCDRFLDNQTIYDAFKNKTPIQFKASYQVMGWIYGADPLDNVSTIVTEQYETYVQNCHDQDVPVVRTPSDFFEAYALEHLNWAFNAAEITYTLDGDSNIETLNLPQKTICNGVMQEVVWDMLEGAGTANFLGNPESPSAPAIWTDDEISIAIGNTSIEALSALLKYDNDNTGNEPDLLENYEYLLDALQLGLLNNIENDDNRLIGLDEALHSAGFARESGGLLWIVQQKPKDPSAPAQPVNSNTEINLPLTLAEELYLLNNAQKQYDMSRGALNLMRKQLYMDWYRYIKMYAGGQESDNVTVNTLSAFLTTKGTGALDLVLKKGNDTGILSYIKASDDSGAISGIQEPAGDTDSDAYKVWSIYNGFMEAMAAFPDWQMLAVPAPAFWRPTDPVALIEGDRIQGVRRNGTAAQIAVRLSPAIINILSFLNAGNTFTVSTSDIASLPVLNPAIPCQEDCQALSNEANLIIPSLAYAVANALQAKGGSGNPAVGSYNNFVQALMLVQGGLSGLETQQQSEGGLYEAIRTPGYIPADNPQQQISTPVDMTVTFTNAADSGWIPDAVAWNTQLQYPDFGTERYDPFLPSSIVWNLSLDPLIRNENTYNYDSGNITDYFALDSNAIDYEYNTGKPFTTNKPVEYDGSVVLSRKSTFSLLYQIDNYENNYPDDPANPDLTAIAENYRGRKILAQSMSGLNTAQLLRYYIPKVLVEDLTMGSRDSVTSAIKTAAITGNPGDNWYDYGFNADAPVPTGPMALGNFGPVRSGFLAVNSLQIIDVFGQRMTISTPEVNPDGSLKVIAAMTMAPQPDDLAHANKVYLPPRIIAPSRLWFRWLSATYNDEVEGVDDDFVEMNTHPSTSPVCGWIMPNHLDNNLFFYNSDGTAIGSFGIEHDALTYRTRAGNPDNPSNLLSVDIGVPGQPLVNEHVASFMWYVNDKSGPAPHNSGFLQDLMMAILKSDKFISPDNFAQDGSLAVLIGRPLAIARSVVSVETAGNVLPLNQADTNAAAPWPMDINAGRTAYADRQAYSSANAEAIQLPLRLGDLHNMDDGLIGYLIEQDGADPYGNGDFYAPAANAGGEHGVTAPSADTIELTLNAANRVFTFLLDPRASIHATTGVLPVEELSVPSDQYKDALSRLEMSFNALPVLKRAAQLTVPLPQQSGYVWSWVAPGNQEPQLPLAANAVNSNALWGYTPQTLLEGWLNLSPDPDKAPDSNE